MHANNPIRRGSYVKFNVNDYGSDRDLFGYGRVDAVSGDVYYVIDFKGDEVIVPWGSVLKISVTEYRNAVRNLLRQLNPGGRWTNETIPPIELDDDRYVVTDDDLRNALGNIVAQMHARGLLGTT